MPELILTGFVASDAGPEEFEVYRHQWHDAPNPDQAWFTCVDHKLTGVGWVTLNASGGLPQFAAKFGVYYESAEDCQVGVSQGKPFPVDTLSHALDLADHADRIADEARAAVASSQD